MKNPIIAFLLAFFPGGGLFYLNKPMRGLFYTLTVFGLPLGGILLIYVIGGSFLVAFLAIVALIVYIINFIDTGITASKLFQEEKADSLLGGQEAQKSEESERFFTIILSFIPGLGHFQLGLMNRGVTLLTAFIGLGVMVFFIAVLTHRAEFLVFLAILPVIWVYGFFDAIQQLNRKQQGKELVDRTILEDFEVRREEGKKSKAVATFLSIFPGAGHLYLGLQRRGIQLMAAFLFSIYILDVLRLGIFLFLIPILWFYSFFDGLQKASKYKDEPLEDTPIISYFMNHQKWVGVGLLFLGLYYLFTNIFIPIFAPVLLEALNIDFQYWFERYFQTAIVCILLIAGGIKLLAGSKNKEEGDHDEKKTDNY
ncbi:hypothetical protein H1Z61_14700 [Bacillus aquiflavi]|uniref:Multi-TM2 domain-containing protein n=1 Tax=Bacillus aquiflavi TaxID=2672567 RepID=A0A6B3W454_9BACI|nr:hypothetical protein [Bacillus aquiflavi]MBA4538348.1 hypothetical protein [Bacillus aquiflavi]NEY82696.1 hypothetical protein [Bacillus aquiflavi]